MIDADRLREICLHRDEPKRMNRNNCVIKRSTGYPRRTIFENPNAPNDLIYVCSGFQHVSCKPFKKRAVGSEVSCQ